MGLLTPEEALTRYRAGGETQEERDWLANEFFANYGDVEYGRKGKNNRVTDTPLSPQEQMQIEWLRSQHGQNSGNNKDDRIKRIRQQNDMEKERMGTREDPNAGSGESRYIVRNKVKNGSAGDAYQIGSYTQRDEGKDDGLFNQVIQKSMPGFDTSDVISIPGIDWVALAAAPFTGGVSTAVLEGLKAAEAGEIGPETVAAIVGAAGGWDAILGSLKDFMPPGGEMPTWVTDAMEYGKEAYDTVANNPYIQDAQDIYGKIRDFTDPVEDIFGNVSDIFGDFDTGGLEQFLPAAATAFAMPERDPLELLPLEYTERYSDPVQFINNPFQESII